MQTANTLKAATLGLFVMVSVSCVVDPHYYGPPVQPRPAYYSPYGYYYYPSVQVYFQYSTGFYFYPSGSIWLKSRVLPTRFRLDPRDRVHLRIESNRPYLYHHKQVKKYQSPKDHKAVPENDRHERNLLHKWHKEQQQYKKEKRFETKSGKKQKNKKHR